jgi:hypothetical protein
VAGDFGNIPVDCPVSFPYTLVKGGTPLVCTYISSDVPPQTTGGVFGDWNIATVQASLASGSGGGVGKAPINFVGALPTTELYKDITINDSLDGEAAVELGKLTAGENKNFPLTTKYGCDADEGSHTNVATIFETGESADATVKVNCYELEVSKDATTSFAREWSWTIDKEADQTNLTLTADETYLVNYKVTVKVLDGWPKDGNFAVSGNITVKNPAPIDATINSVSDLMSDVGPIAVDCGVVYPFTLVAGAELNCTYSSGLPNANPHINTATATRQNYNYVLDGPVTPNGTTDISGIANVTFGLTPTVKVDECIAVSDDLTAGFSDPIKHTDLGTVCAADSPKSFKYSRTVGPLAKEQCGKVVDYVNTASFVAPSGKTGSDNWTVRVTVDCGCTLTQGYWKTHSASGPAPYDDTWAKLAGGLGEKTIFFKSAQTYLQVLGTAPAGNAYYQLAHQYIAAQLNQLNGSSMPPAVKDAFDKATILLNTYTPAQVAALAANNAVRKNFVSYGGILAGYNEGTSINGPKHCSEQSTSVSAAQAPFTNLLFLPSMDKN